MQSILIKGISIRALRQSVPVIGLTGKVFLGKELDAAFSFQLLASSNYCAMRRENDLQRQAGQVRVTNRFSAT